jgi:ABC-type glycerol-3-phosphate transport system permease component
MLDSGMGTTHNHQGTLQLFSASGPRGRFGAYHFMGKYGIEWNRIMAFGVILVLPVIIIFVFLQKYIIGGLTSGAVKVLSRLKG